MSAATERSDGLQSGFYGETPLNANGWSLPRHPVNLGYDRGVAANLGRPSVASVVTPHAPLIISPHSGRAKLSSYLPAQLAPVSPSYPPALPATRTRRPFAGDTEISSRRGPAADLMSEYMEPPPPPAASSRLGSLNSLESLFPPPGPAQSVQSAAPSEVNFKLTPKPQPQTQNRRLDSGEAGDYSERFNGFWNMLHKPESGQQQQARPGSQPRPGVSSKEERIQSMQEELEQLLRLESEESSSAQQLQLYDQIQMMDDAEIQLLADNLAPLLEPRPGSPPQPGNPWRAKPSRAQQQDPVSINNFGSSGLKTVNTDTGGGVRGSTTTARPSTVMDIHVPQGQDTGFFGVGSSLSFAGGEPQEPGRVGAVLNSVGSLHSDQVVQQRGVLGRDPNIVYPHQIRGGQQLRQGPQGPIVSSPRPRPSLAVPQTPLAPQLPHPELGSRAGERSHAAARAGGGAQGGHQAAAAAGQQEGGPGPGRHRHHRQHSPRGHRTVGQRGHLPHRDILQPAERVRHDRQQARPHREADQQRGLVAAAGGRGAHHGGGRGHPGPGLQHRPAHTCPGLGSLASREGDRRPGAGDLHREARDQHQRAGAGGGRQQQPVPVHLRQDPGGGPV